MTPRDRQLVHQSDTKDTESLRKGVNDILQQMYLRIEALEQLKGITVLPDILFETGGTVARGVAPFADGRMRVVTKGFTATGVIPLYLEKSVGAAGLPNAAVTVLWHFAAGSAGSENVIVIDYVTGLAINSKYRLRLGVTRA